MNRHAVQQTYSKTQGSAFAKLILIGEHAVVHGYPAIAVPFKKLHASAQITPVEGPIRIECAFFKGPMTEAPAMMDGLVNTISATLKEFGKAEEGLRIAVASTIPAGRGLGSSAAVAAAAVRALFSFYGHECPKERLLALVHIAETYAHGSPSGIDAATVTADKPIWFQKSEPVQSFALDHNLNLVVADSGQKSDTASAVAAFRQYLDTHPGDGQASLDRLGEWTWAARKALIKGDTHRLGTTLQRAQQQLQKFGVSNVSLNQLIAAANRADALGAKLTGGGRGGCMLALAHDQEHADALKTALLQAGASHVWDFAIGERS